ncbi:hypothetical protein [Cuniculiplasma divulgatum]|uniref:Uncharacterized protein n=1 Tax=Cuniculiplasma divulgatum TaxID=1673428 RepID=A0A1R4A5R6_9ARCH|nr:hypothetical protein [Cuniculiplasma divulgatum]SJK84259.1 hypothetical protein CPM_0374 [Cuniculiplasma divulgatum]
MFLQVSSSKNSDSSIEAKAYTVSEVPPYLAVLIKPQPGIWDELMDMDIMFIKMREKKVIEVKIKQRIEVGENSIFFVTSDDEDFKEICGELS